MTKKGLRSFKKHQESLRKRGMAIAANCSHECYGGIIFNQVIPSQKCRLSTSVRSLVPKALSGRFLELNEELKDLRKPKMEDSDYSNRLVEEFAECEEDKRWSSVQFTDLKWIDKDDPMSGVVAKVSADISSFLDLRVHPGRMKAIWDKLNIEVGEKTNREILAEIEDDFGGTEADSEDTTALQKLDWEEMASLSMTVLRSCESEKKYEKIKSRYMAKVLAPIFDNYTSYIGYVASPDTTYFEIGRPYFYPIIAGARSDGAHEITIFEALNEY